MDFDIFDFGGASSETSGFHGVSGLNHFDTSGSYVGQSYATGNETTQLDSLGRPTSHSFYSSGTLQHYDENFSYQGASRVTGVDVQHFDEKFQYAGREVEVGNTTYKYDADFRFVGQEVVGPDGVSRHYDANYRPAGYSVGGGGLDSGHGQLARSFFDTFKK